MVVEFAAWWAFAVSLPFFLDLGFAVTRRLVVADEKGRTFRLRLSALRVLRDFTLVMARSIVFLDRHRPFKTDILLTPFPVKRGT
jgi:hypothetical protein